MAADASWFFSIDFTSIFFNQFFSCFLIFVIILLFSADVGGYIGLFLGCSVLTVFEVLDFIVCLCFTSPANRKRSVRDNMQAPNANVMDEKLWLYNTFLYSVSQRFLEDISRF